MRMKNRVMKCAIGLVPLFFMAFSCSTIPVPRINYRLPPLSADNFKGKKITLLLEDARDKKGVLGEGALKEFGPFSGNVSLTLSGDKGENVTLGIFDPGSLFMEAFKKRFEDLGVQAVSTRLPGQMILVIVLKEFRLDLIDRKWVVKMGYEAKVEKDGLVIYRNNIKGDGERLKLMGNAQADILMSEVFTDVINRLDLKKVFSGSIL